MGIMRCFFKAVFACLVVCSPLSASSFTVCSYNCGALSGHYDYIRAVCMHKLVQQRCDEEPELMDQLEKIESIALKILFSDDRLAKREWNLGGYEERFKEITAHPDAEESPNRKWRDLSENIVTTYRERPIVIHDEEVRSLLIDHIRDLTHDQNGSLSNEALNQARRVMAKRIFEHELKYDIIALQEADYLDHSLFPKHYEVLFADSKHSVNGFAWNRDRFQFLEEVGNLFGRGFAILLRDLESDKTLLVVSAHLTGCNPFMVENADSARGDHELQAILDLVKSTDADIKLIGMDSNVTATHPRLKLLKDAGFTLDCEKYLEPTCSNPWQILNTRIDWIAVQSASISNIPVNGVGLNSPQTNMSDHKPIAAHIWE